CRASFTGPLPNKCLPCPLYDPEWALESSSNPTPSAFPYLIELTGSEAVPLGELRTYVTAARPASGPTCTSASRTRATKEIEHDVVVVEMTTSFRAGMDQGKTKSSTTLSLWR